MKTALITGASGGIGLEIAHQLASQNYQVTLVARNEEKLQKVMQSLNGNGHSILVVDLTVKEDLEKLAGHIKTVRYNVLINNAGAAVYGKFTEVQIEDHLKVMRLNMDALVVLSYAFLQNASAGDSLVNIGSLIGFSSLPGAAVYAGSKAFVTNFSESLWFEYKNKGIFVMGFNPGATASDFHENAGNTAKEFPKFVVSSVKEVSDKLFAALQERKQPRVVQGWNNKLMLFGFKFLSRKAGIKIMGNLSPGIS
ncbi:SDR family NAD(P)-dependent oxidoreductase [Chryseobacterium populi]|uniref:Short-chain alcohol dehydrogenase n=1 Tax=Chryseobacterium populi TaxID=1144316 RepID=J3CGV8_9FLAO|nr:SDR family NAD(P)-dependent oxidoreductase [Chryseobacterium populi]EJL71419.1 short-chain dehydrogenase of unknown substrate specificity [Chryseobacterium populi]